jgi:hypothetical protein
MVMSSRLAACLIFWVMASSARLGRVLPLGWLWQRTRDVALCSSAFFRMTRGSATVPVMPPSLMISIWITLLPRLRNTTANTSCCRYSRCARRKWAISALLVTRMALLSDVLLRMPSSSAAAILMALTSPIPFTFLFTSSLTLKLVSFRRSFPTLSSNSCATCTAERSRVPALMRMASSSESLRVSAPLSSNFLRGWSSSAHCLIENLRIQKIITKSNYNFLTLYLSSPHIPHSL